MQTIIIATDFSPSSVNAMNYGLDMAKAINANVLLFHAYSVPISVSDTPLMLVSIEDLEKDAKKEMADLKSKVEHVVSGAVSIEGIVKLGDTVDELETLGSEINPFAIIMGSRGGSGVDTLFGSTTIDAVRRLSHPVISIPTGKEYGTGIQRVGFACDYKDVVETIPAAVINQFVQQFSAELHILKVNKSEADKNEHAEQHSLLEKLFAETKPIFDFIKNDDVEDGINEFAELNNLDLLITIPKKHKLLDRLFRKSSVKQLVYHSRVPVMCLHED